LLGIGTLWMWSGWAYLSLCTCSKIENKKRAMQ
jgi:hypothetical protein